jgi:hypothetical protein
VTSPNDWINNLPGPRLKQVIAEHGDALMARHHTDDVHFALWLETLDRAVQRRVLISYDDLEDWPYWDAYEAGMSPRDAALQMLADAGWDVGNVEVIG